jgi:hypothetical protein
MVLAAQRAYSEATRQLRAGRPATIRRFSFARRAVAAGLVAGISLMSLIAVAAPAKFGAPGSRTLRTGWPSWILLGLVLAGCAYGFVKRAEISWLGARVREPWVRPLREVTGFEAAADALAACPSVFQVRFALSWIVRPALLAGLGVTCCLSTAYFLVDAVLARFVVGWGQLVYALGFLGLGLVFFASAATTLASWRVAVSVYKEVNAGYPDQ